MGQSQVDCAMPFYRLIRVARSNVLQLFLFIASAVLISGCASTPKHNKDVNSFEKIDPYEKVNRKSYNFTDFLDRKVMEPIADFYMEWVPVRVQRSVGHFYDNAAYPNVVLNTFL